MKLLKKQRSRILRNHNRISVARLVQQCRTQLQHNGWSVSECKTEKGSFDRSRNKHALYDDIGRPLWLLNSSCNTAQYRDYAALEIAEGETEQRNEKVKPSLCALFAGLKACSSSRDLEQGRILHADAEENGYHSNSFVAATLVNMYAKCGSVLDAHRVFNTMSSHNVVSWTALILGYAEAGKGEVALELFQRMKSEGIDPDPRAYVAALKACSCLADDAEGSWINGSLVKADCLERCMDIHSQVAKSGFAMDMFIVNSLVDLYGRCGSMKDARRVFDSIENHDVVAWTSLVLGYAENGEANLALEAFSCMSRKGCEPDARAFIAALKACTTMAASEEATEINGKHVKLESLSKGMEIHSEAARMGFDRNIFVATVMVDMYAKCGSLLDARIVFDRMAAHNVVTFSSLIQGYAENGESELALEMLAYMHSKGYTPDVFTYGASLKACSASACIQVGRALHAEVCKLGLENDAKLTTSLLDVYCKCGSTENAQLVFDSLRTRDMVAWNALIAGYSHQGDSNSSKRVFNLFEEMLEDGVKAVAASFVSLLTACSHAGLVDRGRRYFEAMRIKYGVNPNIEHYHCMVDLLGRGNKLDEALETVEGMPFGATAVTWRTVLGACYKWNNVEVGRVAFESLLEIDENDATAYMLMTNIFRSTGMLVEVEELRKRAGQQCGHQVITTTCRL